MAESENSEVGGREGGRERERERERGRREGERKKGLMRGRGHIIKSKSVAGLWTLLL